MSGPAPSVDQNHGSALVACELPHRARRMARKHGDARRDATAAVAAPKRPIALSARAAPGRGARGESSAPLPAGHRAAPKLQRVATFQHGGAVNTSWP